MKNRVLVLQFVSCAVCGGVESTDERLARLVADHKQQVAELHQMLDDRDVQAEEIVANYEKQIKVSLFTFFPSRHGDKEYACSPDLPGRVVKGD